MQKKRWFKLLLVMLIPTMMVTVSCGKKKVEDPMSSGASKTTLTDDSGTGDTGYTGDSSSTTLSDDSGMSGSDVTGADETSAQAAAREKAIFLNKLVYFDFDSSVLSPEAQRVLAEKAQWLRNNRSVRVQIEGHCDERGTNEYNLALGDRRAKSVKRYLVDLGVEPTRMTTVSYGEERPAVPGDWDKNRRAAFVLR